MPGQNPGDVFHDAAAGDVGHALDLEIAQKVEDGFDIDPGGGQELLAEGPLQALGDDRIEGELHPFEEDLAGEGISVGVKPLEAIPISLVADGDRRAVDDLCCCPPRRR